MKTAVSERLASLIRETGAVAFGVAQAAPVEPEEWKRFEWWFRRGWQAGMEYMRNYPEIRRDPRLLLDGAQSIVSVAFNYRQPNPYEGQVATYALGEDYHKVLRRRLKGVVTRLRDEFGGQWRVCIDSAPILERYWAVKCGVGRRSPLHGNVIVEGVGSMVFLAELITTLQLEPCSENFVMARAEASPHLLMKGKSKCYPCPTGALRPGGMVDARRCINYLTIEKRDALSDEEREMVGDAQFGCDACLRKAPENAGDCCGVLEEFLPLDGLVEFLKGDNDDFPVEKSAVLRKNAKF